MSNRKDQSSGGGYEVGYGRPPKENRFRPGQSGNPNGRRKKAPEKEDPLDVLNRVLEKTLRPKDGGPPVTRLEALFTTLWRDAVSGDAKARRLMVELLRMGHAARMPTAAANDDDPADDEEVILEGLTRQIARLTEPPGGGDE